MSKITVGTPMVMVDRKHATITTRTPGSIVTAVDGKTITIKNHNGWSEQYTFRKYSGWKRKGIPSNWNQTHYEPADQQ